MSAGYLPELIAGIQQLLSKCSRSHGRRWHHPWKEALERYLPQFLALLFPSAHAGIDWSKGYALLDKELQQVVRDAKLGRRLADKLVRVVDSTGREEWLLIHVEVQGDADPDLPERLFFYNYRIYDRHRHPVVSLAVLADDRTG